MNKFIFIALIATINANIMKLRTDQIIALEGDEPEDR